ncbi:MULTISPECIES: PilW family protein [unclassified Marichromatium]|uniref:PilW family protein n=1 Tax=unclassified Marichromatium TaxID=2618417 RepID=UPI000F3C3FEE|nr:PilW family protein [Marichromatium sp. AB31]RNE91303.1 prepilin-type N-terminal cleavage/methylation domain-containing protein [Marichromatium sp. AB31]
MIRQRGFSLIELMIASTISLMMIAALGAVMVSTRTTQRTTQTLAMLQEDARYAFLALTRDVRMAGYTGGYQLDSAPASWPPETTDIANPLHGLDDEHDTITMSGRTGGDVLHLVRADTDHAFVLDTACQGGAGAARFTLACQPTHSPLAGQTWIATSPYFTETFAVTSTDPSAGCATGATTTLALVSDSTTACGFGSDTATPRLYPLIAHSYFVGTNDEGEPALMVRQDGTDTELVEGVSDLQILYGIDDDADKSVDRYVRADQVSSATTASARAEDWRRVLAIRLTLTLTPTNDLDGTLDDRIVSGTIAVRNRLIQP